MILNIREMLIGDVTRLRYVTRFSTCHVVHRENVAEHSYYVALYAMFIADWVMRQEGLGPVDMRMLLMRSLLHDLDEARTGDFYRPFKYSTSELGEALKAGAHRAFVEVVTSVVGGPATGPAKRFAYLWESSKADDPEGHILSFADFLSVLGYMVQELQVANLTMREHWSTMSDYFQEFTDVRYDFIRPLVDQARTLVCEAFPDQKDQL